MLTLNLIHIWPRVRRKKSNKTHRSNPVDAANKLRGSVEPAEYKHVVLSLIFLKYARNRRYNNEQRSMPRAFLYEDKKTPVSTGVFYCNRKHRLSQNNSGAAESIEPQHEVSIELSFTSGEDLQRNTGPCDNKNTTVAAPNNSQAKHHFPTTLRSFPHTTSTESFHIRSTFTSPITVPLCTKWLSPSTLRKPTVFASPFRFTKP